MKIELRRRSALLWGSALTVVLTSVVSPALGQISESSQTTESFGETLEVHLVSIDVRVESYFGGEPTVDLDRSSFEVYEDGVLRPITHFERVLGGRVQATEENLVASAAPEPLAAGFEVSSGPVTTVDRTTEAQYTVLAFDGLSLGQVRLHQVVRQARDYLRRSASPDSRWSVVVLGGGARVLLPFTEDIRKVEASLESVLDLWRGVPVTGWGDARTFLREERPQPEQPLPTEAEKRNDLQSVETLRAGLEKNLAVWQARILFRGLSELFRGWATLGGSKSLIMFYEPSLVPRHELMEELQEVIREAGAAGFTMYSANAQGLSNPAVLGGTSLLDDSLHKTLAVESGGRDVAVNDLSRVLEMVSDRSENHYRISYQVDRPADGQAHEIEVKLREPGVHRVRHTKRYLDLIPRDRLLRQLETSPGIPKMVVGRLPLDIEVHVEPTLGGVMPVTAVALTSTDGVGLITEEDETRGGIEFFIAIYGEDGHLLQIDSQVQPVFARGGPNGRLVQAFEANLMPGEYTVAMAALDTVDGTVGMTFTRIHP